MALRKSPVRTAAMLAANRANAQKSTGPSTPQGKARVALNPLQHGAYAVGLPEKLLRAGYRQDEAQYRWFRREIMAAFARGLADDEAEADQMAAKAWCAARGVRARAANRECRLESGTLSLRVPVQSRIGLVDLRRRIGLVFWVQRPRFWTRQKQERPLAVEEVFGPSRGRLEGCWRRLRYRSHKPSPWEGWILEHEAWGRTPAAKRDQTNAVPVPPASRPRPPVASETAQQQSTAGSLRSRLTLATVLDALPPAVEIPHGHPPLVVQCHDPKGTLLPASPPALGQRLSLARKDLRRRLRAALRELARDWDLDGRGLTAAFLAQAFDRGLKAERQVRPISGCAALTG